MRYISSNYHLCKSDTQVLIRSRTHFLPYTLLSQCSRARRTPLLSPAGVGRGMSAERGRKARVKERRSCANIDDGEVLRSRACSATRQESAFSTTQFPSRRSPSFPPDSLPPEMFSRSPVQYYTRCRHFSPKRVHKQAELIKFWRYRHLPSLA